MTKPEKMTQRIFHAPRSLWRAVRVAANAEGVSMSEWIRGAIADRLSAPATKKRKAKA